MSPFALLYLLLPFISTSWAQSNSSAPTSSISSTTSSIASSNMSISASLTSSAQFPSLSGYSSCVTNCLAEGIARVNCSSITDINCFCANSTFPDEVFSCIESGCPTELTAEEKLAQQFCNLASASPTLTFPSAVPSTPSSTSTPVSSSSQSTPSATPKASSGMTLISGTELLDGLLTTLVYMFYIYLL